MSEEKNNPSGGKLNDRIPGFSNDSNQADASAAGGAETSRTPSILNIPSIGDTDIHAPLVPRVSDSVPSIGDTNIGASVSSGARDGIPSIGNTYAGAPLAPSSIDGIPSIGDTYAGTPTTPGAGDVPSIGNTYSGAPLAPRVIDSVPALGDTEVDGFFVPAALDDDPIISDGSTSRRAVDVLSWRISTLEEDQLMDMAVPEGNDRRSRKARRAHERSRKAREGEHRTKRNKTRLVVGILLAFVLIGITTAAYTYVHEYWGGKSIPGVVGESEANAVKELKDKGFEVEVKTALSDAVEGHVVEVDPAMGTRAEEGSTVILTVGKSRVLPDVVGMSKKKAQKALKKVGAENIRFEKRNTLDKENVVVESKPAAGAVFMSSDEIIVYISQHPVMPDIVGEPQDTALALLKREGIPAEVKRERGDASQRRHVMNTSPAAGEPVTEKGAVVTVGDTLIDIRRLPDYLDTEASRVNEFMQEQGYQPRTTHLDSEDRIVAGYANDAGDMIAFQTDPWSHAVRGDRGGIVNIMEDKRRVDGIRMMGYLARADKVEVKTNANAANGNANQNSGGHGDDGGADDSYVQDDAYSQGTDQYGEDYAEGQDADAGDQNAEGQDAAQNQEGQDAAQSQDGQNNTADDKEKADDAQKQKQQETQQQKTTTREEWHSLGSALMPVGDPSIGEGTAHALMELFGLSNMQDSCTQNDITIPKTASKQGHDFYCCQGVDGNNVWTVMVRRTTDEGGRSVMEGVVTYAPRSAYSRVDLHPFGGSICDFVAYWDEYTA